jgi:hypothetical protein
MTKYFKSMMAGRLESEKGLAQGEDILSDT